MKGRESTSIGNMETQRKAEKGKAVGTLTPEEHVENVDRVLREHLGTRKAKAPSSPRRQWNTHTAKRQRRTISSNTFSDDQNS
jgi:hypothetical protein